VRQDLRDRAQLRLDDRGAAVSVAHGREVRCGVLAEQSQRRRMDAVAHRERAAGAGRVLRISERGMGAEGDVRQIDSVARERLRQASRDHTAVHHARVGDDHADAAGADVEIRRRVAADEVVVPPEDTNKVLPPDDTYLDVIAPDVDATSTRSTNCLWFA
jgi:hypothetical protein